MFAYYLDLAIRSLKRTPVLTGLMVLAIGLGIGASMTMLTVLHVMTADPMPGRSVHLYKPWLDPLPITYNAGSATAPDPRSSLTWPDAEALLQSQLGVRKAAMAGGRLLVFQSGAGLQPFFIDGEYASADFFPLFGVPFTHGSGWTRADDHARAHVVVITATLARRLFGARDPVGQSVMLSGAGDTQVGFRVVGVVADWTPKPLFYEDSSAKRYSDADQFFLPLSTAIDLKLPFDGNQNGWGSSGTDWRLSPNVSWLQFWVQLGTPDAVRAYRQFLVNYSAQQKALGRFQRPPTDAKLFSLMGWLRHERMVPDDVKLQAWLALGFLGVAMLNVVALLLAKFLRRSGEISVRRAMGARRRDIFAQFGIESAVIGIAGGLLGLAIAEIGLWTIRRRPEDYAHLARMDPGMLIATVLLAIVASVLAGLLPAWQACRVPPALQLKAN